MPTIQTRNQDLEKRLAHLRSQLYGKSSTVQPVNISVTGPISQQTNTSTHLSTDVVYLRRDLFKIFILAGLAFAFQFSLYIALLKNIIKLSI